jgi:hypothetical protein
MSVLCNHLHLMKNFISFLILTSLVLSTSCKSTLMRLAGVREPKIESKKSIFKFLEKLKEDTNNVYTLDSTLFQKLQQQDFKPGMAKSFRPVQIRLYGKSGEPIMQWASCEGFLADLKIFDTVPPRVINGLDTSLNLAGDLSRYFTLEGKPAKIIIPENFDYYILIYFAKYFPKLSKESFSQVNLYRTNHPEIKCMVYKINVDVQEFWNVELRVDSKTQIGGDR